MGAPLVTVIVRTMGRTELPEALSCIAAQNHRAIEVVVVDARGRGELRLADTCGAFPLRVVNPGQRLLRPAAAYAGMDAARGEWIAFLDEDDLFEPAHIALLMQGLRDHAQCMAAYAGAYWHFDADRPPRILHAQYSREYLLAQNFLTPSAVIFSRELLQRGCRFDETLTICEDWDFWIQLSGHTRFLRTGAMTSYWRAWKGESGTGARQDADHLMQTTAAVTRKWAALAQQLNRETRVLLEQGLARQREDDWRGAQTLYRQVLESNPYNANALNLAGMVALHFGRHDVAIPLLVRAAGLSGAAPFYYNLGLAFETSDQLESARKAYAMALDIDPGFEPARTKLA